MISIAVITGPTASGKTRLAAELARELGGEVVSADSMQIYRDMDIGTAKPDEREKLGVPHHMFDVVGPEENYSVARYVEDASRAVEDIAARGKLPIVAGGTGFYIDALISGTDFAKGQVPELRDELSREYDSAGGDAMLARLRHCDTESASRLHPNDKKRIIRALEVYISTGKTLSEHDRETKTRPPRYRACKIALGFKSREELYRRIDLRVDEMFARGLAEETRALLERGISPERHTSMQAIGYKETALALYGEMTMAEAVEIIKRETRRYAKRQLTWFRRDKTMHWILWDKQPDFEEASRLSTEFLEKDGII